MGRSCPVDSGAPVSGLRQRRLTSCSDAGQRPGLRRPTLTLSLEAVVHRIETIIGIALAVHLSAITCTASGLRAH